MKIGLNRFVGKRVIIHRRCNDIGEKVTLFGVLHSTKKHNGMGKYFIFLTPDRKMIKKFLNGKISVADLFYKKIKFYCLHKKNLKVIGHQQHQDEYYGHFWEKDVEKLLCNL